MKSFYFKFTLAALFLLAFSSNIFAQENTEVINEETSVEENVIEENNVTETDAYSEPTQTAKPKKQKEKKAFITFGNKEKFTLLDTMSVFTPNAVGKFKSTPGTITIDLKEKTAGFGSTYLLTYYILQFDIESVKKIQKAYDTYVMDFNNKKLNRKNKKAYKAYGDVNVKLNWGALKTSTPNNAVAYCNIGYDFCDGSPFFCLVVYPSYNFYSEVDDGAEKESSTLKYCFTKAQGKQLIDLLLSEEIADLFNDYDKQLYINTNVEKDSY